MATVSERLRGYAGPIRMNNGCSGDLSAEAADTIDALVAALESIATEMRPLAARKHTRYAGRALALARKGG